MTRVVRIVITLPAITGAKRVLGAVRSHWGIENELHWALDIDFDEDRCRVRKDHGPEKFCSTSSYCPEFAQHEKTCKRGIQGKRLLAAWNHTYLLKVLAGFSQLQN